MSCLCRARTAAKHKWGRIHLVDKCLLIILGILLVQSAINLFLHEGSATETNGIDVVIRTSAAGIFGYLISTNFDQQRKRGERRTSAGGKPEQSRTAVDGDVKAQIGFDTGGGEMTSTVPSPPRLSQHTHEGYENCDRAQILVVAGVGIVSLCILTFYRNFGVMEPGDVGSLTQFRDFVSGSVGFLVSSSTSGMRGREVAP